jgi:hypothetical protein
MVALKVLKARKGHRVLMVALKVLKAHKAHKVHKAQLVYRALRA